MKHAYICNTIVFLLLMVSPFGQALAAEGHDGSHSSEAIPKSFFEGASETNGKSIYYVGMTIQGKPIPFEGGPHWLTMHGGGCAECHGNNGQGGITPMMCVKSTPPVTLKALMSGGHEHAGEKDTHTPYTLKTLRRALKSSVNLAGRPLTPCMPRWELTDDQFRDLVFYLKALSQ